MTQPSGMLKRWHPLYLAVHQLTGPTTVTFEDEPPETTLLVDIDRRMANHRNLVTLHRAAQVNGLLDSLFEPTSRLEGQPWYDRLPRIVAMDTEAVIDGEKMSFTWADDAAGKQDELQKIVAALSGSETNDASEWVTSEIGHDAVAEDIVVRILVRTEHETQARRLPTDFGVGAEFANFPDEAGIMVTADCALAIDALENLIAEAVFEDSIDDTNDCRETQWQYFMESAHTVAARLLLNEREASAESIREAARRHLGYLLPDDRTVQLRKKPAPPGEEIADVEVVILRDDQAHGGS